MEEETRARFENAVKRLVQISPGSEGTQEAIQELEQALGQILEERDKQWKEHIERHEEEMEAQERPERERSVEPGSAYKELLGRELEEAGQNPRLTDILGEVLEQVEIYLGRVEEHMEVVEEAFDLSGDELDDEMDDLRRMKSLLEKQVRGFERLKEEFGKLREGQGEAG